MPSFAISEDSVGFSRGAITDDMKKDGVRVKFNGPINGPQHPPKELQPQEGNRNSLG